MKELLIDSEQLEALLEANRRLRKLCERATEAMSVPPGRVIMSEEAFQELTRELSDAANEDLSNP